MAIPPPSPATTCLVTGASSGIGAQLARQLAQKGRGVTLAARREDRLRALAEELTGRHGVRAEVVACDVSLAAERSRLVEEVAGRGLGVAVLVNNAGFSTTGPVANGDHDREVALVRTNVEAVVDLCSLVVPSMVERGGGAILNVASTAAFQPLPGQSAYAASKAFVLSYSQALRAELRGTGVGVTVLCPGPVDTEFNEVAGLSDAEAESSLPRFMWVPAEKVAAAALDGMERDQAVVVPGWANRAGAAGARLAPQRLLAGLVAKRHPALRR